MFWWNYKLITRVLSDCVMRGKGAFVMFPEIATFYPATFASINETQVQMKLFPSRDTDVRSASYCCVTFRHEHKPYFFVSAVNDFRKASSPRLVLDFPDRLFVEKRRLAYRVPVLPDCGLIAAMTAHSAKVYAPEIIDLSLTGALLDFPNGGPELAVGTTIELALLLDAHAVSLVAEVRRQENSAYGVEFINVFDETGLNPPESLKTILETAEREWFNHQFRETAQLFRNADGEAHCDRDAATSAPIQDAESEAVIGAQPGREPVTN